MVGLIIVMLHYIPFDDTDHPVQSYHLLYRYLEVLVIQFPFAYAMVRYYATACSSHALSFA